MLLIFRLLSIFTLLLSLTSSFGFNGINKPYFTDSLVKIVGKVTDANSDTAVAARITYEKLPYGDDMGISNSTMPSGDYEMYMIKGAEYLIKVTCKGYEPYNQEHMIKDEDFDGLMTLNIQLQPAVQEQVMRLENLLFRSGSDEISESSFEELDELAELMKNSETMVIQLEGHTDIAGGEEANLDLSQRRVEAVKAYLEDKKIKGNRIRVKAYGETQPLTTERTPEGKRLNRRVEVRIIRQ